MSREPTSANRAGWMEPPRPFTSSWGRMSERCVLFAVVVVSFLYAVWRDAAVCYRRSSCAEKNKPPLDGSIRGILKGPLEPRLRASADHGRVRGTLVVLLTPRLLHSPWCLGEVTTAFKHGVHGVKQATVFEGCEGLPPPGAPLRGQVSLGSLPRVGPRRKDRRA